MCHHPDQEGGYVDFTPSSRIRPTRTSSHDARTISRLISGHSLNGDADGVSDSFAGIVGSLASLPPDERLPLWVTYIAGQANADEITLAVANADPTAELPHEAPATPKKRVKVTAASEMGMKPVEWLWKPRIPRGMLTLFA